MKKTLEKLLQISKNRYLKNRKIDMFNIIDYLENSLNIKFTSIPNLKINKGSLVLPEEEKEKGFAYLFTLQLAQARYNPFDDTIYLNPRQIRLLRFFNGNFERWGCKMKLEKIQDVLAHELGHAYSFSISPDKQKRQLLKSKKDKEKLETLYNFEKFNSLTHKKKMRLIDLSIQMSKDKTRDLNCNLISEGISEYFRKEYNKSHYNEKVEWLKYSSSSFYGGDSVYECGYYLVKPIIDKFGKKGIEYLALNIPKGEITDPILYQQKIITALQNLSVN